MSLQMGIAFNDTGGGSQALPAYAAYAEVGNTYGSKTYTNGNGQTLNGGYSVAAASDLERLTAGSPDSILNGIHYDLGTGDRKWKADLASGSGLGAVSTDYRLAGGDGLSAWSNIKIRFNDGAGGTAFINRTSSTTAAAKFRDATDVERTSVSDWLTNNAVVTKVMTATVLEVHHNESATGITMISYLEIIQTSGGAALAIPVLLKQYRQRGQ